MSQYKVRNWPEYNEYHERSLVETAFSRFKGIFGSQLFSKIINNQEAEIIFVPVHHEGNTQASDEEVVEIKHLAYELLTRTLTAIDGSERKVTWDDMLFVAPYNYQCRKLKEALGPQAKVGSVDKFQGQEAPIVFLSMCG
jgi:uncharacterized protein